MKLSLEGDRVVITPFGPEYSKLEKFPGLFKNGPYFFMPRDPRVVYNLVSRIRLRFNRVEISSDVQRIIDEEFRLRPIPPDFKFYTTPKNFQEIALRYMYTCGGGGLLLEPGMGKTKVVLDFIALMGFRRSVIICPLPLLFVWQYEKEVHRPDKTMHLVTTTNKDEEVEKMLEADITVINYTKAWMFAERMYEPEFDFIGLDEGLIKDPSSLRTRYVTTLSNRIRHPMLMSGTLVNNSPLDIFAPVRFLQPCLVGNSFGKFKQEYSVLTKFDSPSGRREFTIGYKNVPEVRSILDSVSIVMTKDQWLDLPEKKFFDVHVQISDEQREFYQGLQSNYIAKTPDGEVVEITNPLVALCKLMQVSNGFIYSQAEDDSIEDLCVEEAPGKKKRKSRRKTYFFREQPKIAALRKLLTEKLSGRRGIIWFNMSAEFKLISTLLEEMGVPFLSIQGGDKKVGEKVVEFNRNPRYLWLVCQAKSVNYGVTVLGKDYDEDEYQIPPGLTPEVFTEIFYSLNFSLEVYLQQQDRIHRLGQEHICEYYRLIANTSAERNVVEKIDEKIDIRGQMLVDIVVNLLGMKLV